MGSIKKYIYINKKLIEAQQKTQIKLVNKNVLDKLIHAMDSLYLKICEQTLESL